MNTEQVHLLFNGAIFYPCVFKNKCCNILYLKDKQTRKSLEWCSGLDRFSVSRPARPARGREYDFGTVLNVRFLINILTKPFAFVQKRPFKENSCQSVFNFHFQILSLSSDDYDSLFWGPHLKSDSHNTSIPHLVLFHRFHVYTRKSVEDCEIIIQQIESARKVEWKRKKNQKEKDALLGPDSNARISSRRSNRKPCNSIFWKMFGKNSIWSQ